MGDFVCPCMLLGYVCLHSHLPCVSAFANSTLQMHVRGSFQVLVCMQSPQFAPSFNHVLVSLLVALFLTVSRGTRRKVSPSLVGLRRCWLRRHSAARRSRFVLARCLCVEGGKGEGGGVSHQNVFRQGAPWMVLKFFSANCFALDLCFSA